MATGTTNDLRTNELRNELRMVVQELPEKVREKQAVDTLRSLGYEVATLGKPIHVRCKNPQCRAEQWAKHTGNSPGVSDVIVSHPTRWPSGTWKMLETKKSDRAARRKEQVRYAELGLATFYVTQEQAVRAILDVEQRMGLDPNPALLNWLRCNVKGAWHAEVQALLADDTPNAAWRP